MTTAKSEEAMLPRIKHDWYSATRQAKRDAIKLGWARHVLEEEGIQPSTHSPSSVRRAETIVSLLQYE